MPQETAAPVESPISRKLDSHPNSILRSPAAPSSLDPLPGPPRQTWTYPDSRTAPTSNPPGALPNFRADLGHRDAAPTIRNYAIEDYGQEFDFEKKKREYPPMGEILATGRYFVSANALYLKPSFQGNTAISESNSGVSTPFDFDYEAGHQFWLGFESKYGPGFEIDYMQYDESSNEALFTSDGVETGSAAVWMKGPYQWSRLAATNAGETLEAEHSLDVESIGAMFFKAVQLPISRINGKFGFQYVSIEHNMAAVLTDSGGTEIGSLFSRSDIQAIGPQLRMEYYRPVGHTKFEIMTGFGGSVLFGKQDQFVQNSATGQFSRVGADEFITTTEFKGAIQYRKMLAEKQYWYVRTGYEFETWHGGGTAVLPQDDFGLRGFTFTLGLNR